MPSVRAEDLAGKSRLDLIFNRIFLPQKRGAWMVPLLDYRMLLNKLFLFNCFSQIMGPIISVKSEVSGSYSERIIVDVWGIKPMSWKMNS